MPPAFHLFLVRFYRRVPEIAQTRLVMLNTIEGYYRSLHNIPMVHMHQL